MTAADTRIEREGAESGVCGVEVTFAR